MSTQGIKCVGGPLDGKTVVIQMGVYLFWCVPIAFHGDREFEDYSFRLVPNDKALMYADVEGATGIYVKVARRGTDPILYWKKIATAAHHTTPPHREGDSDTEGEPF